MKKFAIQLLCLGALLLTQNAMGAGKQKSVEEQLKANADNPLYLGEVLKVGKSNEIDWLTNEFKSKERLLLVKPKVLKQAIEGLEAALKLSGAPTKKKGKKKGNVFTNPYYASYYEQAGIIKAQAGKKKQVGNPDQVRNELINAKLKALRILQVNVEAAHTPAPATPAPADAGVTPPTQQAVGDPVGTAKPDNDGDTSEEAYAPGGDTSGDGATHGPPTPTAAALAAAGSAGHEDTKPVPAAGPLEETDENVAGTTGADEAATPPTAGTKSVAEAAASGSGNVAPPSLVVDQQPSDAAVDEAAKPAAANGAKSTAAALTAIKAGGDGKLAGLTPAPVKPASRTRAPAGKSPELLVPGLVVGAAVLVTVATLKYLDYSKKQTLVQPAVPRARTAAAR